MFLVNIKDLLTKLVTLTFFLMVVQGSVLPSVNRTTRVDKSVSPSCTFGPGLLTGSETPAEECCNQIKSFFHRYWSIGSLYLTTYLHVLRTWNCPQFEQECNDRLFVFNTFTGLVFDYFCNFTNFVDECFDTVNLTYKEALKRSESKSDNAKISTDVAYTLDYVSSTNNSKPNEWTALIHTTNNSILRTDELLRPCVQVYLYRLDEDNFKDYVELIDPFIPSCSPVWCGFTGKTIQERIISIWNCLQNQCRANLIIFMITCGLLAILTTFANLSVILVYIFNPLFLSSQGIYKLSLAVADIIVGLVVFPTFITSLSKSIIERVNFVDVSNATGYEVTDGRIYVKNSENQTLPFSNNIGISNNVGFSTNISQTYLDFVGFFTQLSFSVSIYCLVLASFDRLKAIRKPLDFDKEKARVVAKWQCIIVWGCGIAFALIPIFVPELRYNLTLSLLVISFSAASVYLYAIVLVIPILVLWVVNIVILVTTRRSFNLRAKLTNNLSSAIKLQIRLAKTVSIMVGAFTFSILPAPIVVLASYFIPNLSPAFPREFNPESNKVFLIFEMVTVILLACNSLWNFFIYNARNEDFRQAVKKICRLQ